MPKTGTLQMSYRQVSYLCKFDRDWLLTILRADLKRALSAISEIPDALLRAELLRRDGASDDTPACGSKQRGAYNTPLHVMALFLILGLSTFGMHWLLLHPSSWPLLMLKL